MKKLILITAILLSSACSAEEFTEAMSNSDLINPVDGRHVTALYTVQTGLADPEWLQVVQFTPMGSHQSCVVTISPNQTHAVSCYTKASSIDVMLNYFASLILGDE